MSWYKVRYTLRDESAKGHSWTANVNALGDTRTAIIKAVAQSVGHPFAAIKLIESRKLTSKELSAMMRGKQR